MAACFAVLRGGRPTSWYANRVGASKESAWGALNSLAGGSIGVHSRSCALPHRLQQDQQFPFVVVAPLCAEGEIWTDTDALVQLVDEVVRNYRVDNKRVYVTGHSMGGRGALYLAYKYPERFAAVVAMSPLSPITAWAKQLHNVSLWIIHGAKDRCADHRLGRAFSRNRSGGRTSAVYAIGRSRPFHS